MTGELYNELYKDFENLYNFNKKGSEESKELIENLKRVDERNGGVVDMSTVKNPFVWLVEYSNMIDTLIKKLESINPDYTKKFYEELSQQPTEMPKYPQIFICFRKLVKSVDNENYEESDRLKTKILTKF